MQAEYPIDSSLPQPAVGRWPASLSLRIEQRADGHSVLRHKKHSGPLFVQKPFHPEGPTLPHLYLLHPPGGLVSGDDLQVDIGIGAEAAALFTTPGAARFYRARPDRCPQRSATHIEVAAGASCEWLPLENIVYPDASAQLLTEIELAANSRFIGWDLTLLGLPASNAPFRTGDVLQQWRVSRDGKPWLQEQLRLDMADAQLFTGSAGLRGHCVHGLMLAGPFNDAAQLEALVAQLRVSAARLPHLLGADVREPLWGITALRGFVLLRYLGHQVEDARRLFRHAWQQLRPALLQRPACAPRIWAT